MTEPISLPGVGPKMETERRFGQQEMLERLLQTTDHIHDELGKFTLAMTDRVAKIEQDTKNMGMNITSLSIISAKQSESINWIKGAGAASVVILTGMIIWILSHLMFKP